MADQEREPMVPVTSANPCPICGRVKYCLIRSDGTKCICTKQESTHIAGEGGWLHILVDTPLPSRSVTSRKTTSAKTVAVKDTQQTKPTKKGWPEGHWQRQAEYFANELRTRRPELRSVLESWLHLPAGSISEELYPLVGWRGISNRQPFFSLPESDAKGRIVGWTNRYAVGCGETVKGEYTEKCQEAGCNRGLVIPANFQRLTGSFFSFEGHSDTFAAVHAGMCAVGRPFDKGGIKLLAQLLKGWPADRGIIICGENDKKENGDWPGALGAMTVAKSLARLLGRPITIAFPPADVKDARAWLTHPDRGEMTWAERGAEFARLLMMRTETFECTDSSAQASTSGCTDEGGTGGCGDGGGGDDDPELSPQAQFQLDMERVKKESQKATDKKEKEPSPGALLVRRATERFELFCDRTGEAFASKNKVVAFPVESETFTDELYDVHEQHVDKIEYPTTAQIKNAYKKLAAVARKSEEKIVGQRAVRHIDEVNGDCVLVYRNDRDHYPIEVVHIDRTGWRLRQGDIPVRFQHRRMAGILPQPVAGGTIDDFRPFLNVVNDHHAPVLAAWVAAALAGVSSPIVMLLGEQGSAKSTLARKLMWLIDPTNSPMEKAALLLKPKKPEDVMVAAKNCSIMAYDNLSGIDAELADLLCMVATGGTFQNRKLYTNSEQHVVDLQKPTILTGLDRSSLRGDFLSRMMPVHLKAIESSQRKTDDQVNREFLAARPKLLGYIFGLVARGLDTSIDLSGWNLSRMGWFHQFAARAVGPEVVNAVFEDDTTQNHIASLESCVIRKYLLKLMDENGNRWFGTTEEMLLALNTLREPEKEPDRWPKDPTRLSTQITRFAPALRCIEGIQFEDQRTNKRRNFLVTRTKADGHDLTDLTGLAGDDELSGGGNETLVAASQGTQRSSGLSSDLKL